MSLCLFFPICKLRVIVNELMHVRCLEQGQAGKGSNECGHYYSISISGTQTLGPRAWQVFKKGLLIELAPSGITPVKKKTEKWERVRLGWGWSVPKGRERLDSQKHICSSIPLTLVILSTWQQQFMPRQQLIPVCFFPSAYRTNLMISPGDTSTTAGTPSLKIWVSAPQLSSTLLSFNNCSLFSLFL